MHTIEADYLVVGAGGMGMAFADTIVTETRANVAMVDHKSAPGGHWTTAYPFVRLHQPSASTASIPAISAATPSIRSAGTRVSTSWRPRARCAPTTTRSCSSDSY